MKYLIFLPLFSFGQMKFSCGKTDTVYISVNNSNLIVNFSGEHHNWKSITIGFVDGDQLVIPSDNCYFIPNKTKLMTTKFDYISFDDKSASLACINIKTKDYFIKELNK